MVTDAREAEGPEVKPQDQIAFVDVFLSGVGHIFSHINRLD
jgi:hypothetical protein